MKFCIFIIYYKTSFVKKRLHRILGHIAEFTKFTKKGGGYVRVTPFSDWFILRW